METLRSGDVAAVLDPLGGRLAQLYVQGHELLAPVAEAWTQAGCYPMVPWAGRLDRGRFSFDGVDYEMALTMAPHAMHGLGTAVQWQETGPGTMELSLEGLWPLGGTTKVSYTLTSSNITCVLSVTAGDHPMPAVIGWHPCFVRDLAGSADHLDFHPSFMWTRGPDYLPTGEQQPIPAGPWDDCFGGVADPPGLSWGDALSIELYAPTSTWVAFDMLDTIICVEPQTDTPNAFNMSGGTVLQPGKSLSLPLEIRWNSPFS